MAKTGLNGRFHSRPQAVRGEGLVRIRRAWYNLRTQTRKAVASGPAHAGNPVVRRSNKPNAAQSEAVERRWRRATGLRQASPCYVSRAASEGISVRGPLVGGFFLFPGTCRRETTSTVS